MNDPRDSGDEGTRETHDDPLERLRQFERERGFDEPEDEPAETSDDEGCGEEPHRDTPEP